MILPRACFCNNLAALSLSVLVRIVSACKTWVLFFYRAKNPLNILWVVIAPYNCDFLRIRRQAFSTIMRCSEIAKYIFRNFSTIAMLISDFLVIRLYLSPFFTMSSICFLRQVSSITLAVWTSLSRLRSDLNLMILSTAASKNSWDLF